MSYSAVGAILGFLRVGSDYAEKADAVADASYETVEMPLTAAENVWAGYLRNATGAAPDDVLSAFAADPSAAADPSGNPEETAGYAAMLGRRIADANFYYALDALAGSYISIRIGNIGAQQNSKVAQILMQKAQGLQAIAKAGIARFEEWCKTEAMAQGANYMSTIQGLSALENHAGDGLAEAEDFYVKNAADFDFAAPSLAAADPTWGYILSYGGYGYALKNTAMQMMSRDQGFADARNPAIGQYYQQAGQAAMELATKIIEIYEQFVVTQKIQQAVLAARI